MLRIFSNKIEGIVTNTVNTTFLASLQILGDLLTSSYLTKRKVGDFAEVNNTIVEHIQVHPDMVFAWLDGELKTLNGQSSNYPRIPMRHQTSTGLESFAIAVNTIRALLDATHTSGRWTNIISAATAEAVGMPPFNSDNYRAYVGNAVNYPNCPMRCIYKTRSAPRITYNEYGGNVFEMKVDIVYQYQFFTNNEWIDAFSVYDIAKSFLFAGINERPDKYGQQTIYLKSSNWKSNIQPGEASIGGGFNMNFKPQLLALNVNDQFVLNALQYGISIPSINDIKFTSSYGSHIDVLGDQLISSVYIDERF